MRPDKDRERDRKHLKAIREEPPQVPTVAGIHERPPAGIPLANGAYVQGHQGLHFWAWSLLRNGRSLESWRNWRQCQVCTRPPQEAVQQGLQTTSGPSVVSQQGKTTETGVSEAQAKMFDGTQLPLGLEVTVL